MLHEACGHGIESHVGTELLISHERCDVNLQDSRGETALMITVQLVKYDGDKHAKIIQLLLGHPRIDVNKQNKSGETALGKACGDAIESHVGAQLLLSDEKRDINEHKDFGYTALTTAVRWVQSENDKHAKIIRLLLAHPIIDVNQQDKDGKTALHKACDIGLKLI